MTSNKWLEWAMEKYSTDEAGVREIMANRGKKGLENREAKLKASGQKHRGGFSDPELAKQAGNKGRAKRYGTK